MFRRVKGLFANFIYNENDHKMQKTFQKKTQTRKLLTGKNKNFAYVGVVHNLSQNCFFESLAQLTNNVNFFQRKLFLTNCLISKTDTWSTAIRLDFSLFHSVGSACFCGRGRGRSPILKGWLLWASKRPECFELFSLFPSYFCCLIIVPFHRFPRFGRLLLRRRLMAFLPLVDIIMDFHRRSLSFSCSRRCCESLKSVVIRVVDSSTDNAPIPVGTWSLFSFTSYAFGFVGSWNKLAIGVEKMHR